MKTRVVHCKKESYDVYIGRPHSSISGSENAQWGNPYVVGIHGSRQEVIRKHREWLMKHPEVVRAVQRELTGKVLG